MELTRRTGTSKTSKAYPVCSATRSARRAFHRSEPGSRPVWWLPRRPRHRVRPRIGPPGAMAKHIGISVSSVQRIDPRCADKLLDIVGLYVNPPEHAVVLSIDEKSQIQALDRTQPGLPMKKGRCGTMTHYKRNGTTTLFAALNVLDGTMIGRCMQRHRHQAFYPLSQCDGVPKGKAIHAIVDNYAAHKHPKVQEWLARHLGGFFAKLTNRRLKRGVFCSVVELQALAAVKRGHQVLDSIH
jgi:hypothetical protein